MGSQPEWEVGGTPRPLSARAGGQVLGELRSLHPPPIGLVPEGELCRPRSMATIRPNRRRLHPGDGECQNPPAIASHETLIVARVITHQPPRAEDRREATS